MATLRVPDVAQRVPPGSLLELGLRHRAGKAAHKHYLGLYERYLTQRRDRVRSVLELGVEQGGSLLMWLDWFPEASVVGVDVAEVNQPAGLRENGRAFVYQYDQCDEKNLAAVSGYFGNWDLIVDDAGHDPLKQRRSLEILWPHLRPGGLHVVEDLETSFFALAAWNVTKLNGCNQEGWENPAAVIPYLKSLADGLTAGYVNYDLTSREAPRSREPFARLEGLEAIHFHPNICFLEKS